MLFEEDKLTPGKRAAALSRLFHSYAHKAREWEEEPHVPVEVVTTHGELETRVRYMLEAAFNTRPAAQRTTLKRIGRLLDALPESIMTTLPASPEQDWMRFYRDLVKLHDMLDEAGLYTEEEEYSSIVTKMAQLAAAVSAGSAVSVNAGGMFSLWLMQAHLRKFAPRRRRATRRKKKSAKSRRSN